MNYFLIVAPQDNWVISLQQKICGVPPAEINRVQWKKAQPKDVALLYATAPVKGLIGYARILEKLEDYSPLWPQEKQKGKALWPYRIRLTEIYTLSKENWLTKRVKVDPQISVQRSIRAIHEMHGLTLLRQIEDAIKNS